MSKEAIVFELNDKGGFYSVFFFLCQAYIHAQRTKRDFFITHNDWYYTYENGWHDYFTSLVKWQPEFTEKYKTITIMGHMNCPEQQYTTKDYMTVIKEIYQLKPALKEQAEQILSQNPNLATLFVRRGDKITYGEAPFIEVADIVKKTDLANYTTIFVQSDDCRITEELRTLMPQKTILSTTPPDKFGSHSRVWKRMPVDQRQKQSEEMFIGLYVCTHSAKCWTDYTSNVGRFLKLANFENTRFYSAKNKTPVFKMDKIIINPAYGFTDF